jgi:hypothetical protein
VAALPVLGTAKCAQMSARGAPERTASAFLVPAGVGLPQPAAEMDDTSPADDWFACLHRSPSRATQTNCKPTANQIFPVFLGVPESDANQLQTNLQTNRELVEAVEANMPPWPTMLEWIALRADTHVALQRISENRFRNPPRQSYDKVLSPFF